MKPRHQQLLELIRAHQPAHISVLIDATGLSLAGVTKNLQQMTALGLCHCTSRSRAGRWVPGPKPIRRAAIASSIWALAAT